MLVNEISKVIRHTDVMLEKRYYEQPSSAVRNAINSATEEDIKNMIQAAIESDMMSSERGE